jgi:organic radical activating enzyme
MNLRHHTISFCPTCFLEIPATVHVHKDSVRMVKECPAHGPTEGLVERDALFYQNIKSINSPSIYDGYFVDVTRTCNLRCSRCFYHLEKEDPEGEYSLTNILNECRVNRSRAPFIITGGEPTLRPDIVELLTKVKEIGPIELLTNGTKIASEQLFSEVMPLLTTDGVANLNLSLHLKETDKWMEVIARCQTLGIKIESALIVVENKDEFWKAVELAKMFKDTVLSFRIKAASLLWNEQRPSNKIFVSDMWNWLEESGKPVRMIPQRHNKVSIVNVLYEGCWLMLVSWYDRTNIDLVDVDCAPWYRARNGQVENFVTACLINEGYEQGWLKGRKIAK